MKARAIARLAGDAACLPPPPPLPPGATTGQRWRFLRNLVIAAAYRAGFSQRQLATVFDLPRSRIAAILKEVGTLAARYGVDVDAGNGGA